MALIRCDNSHFYDDQKYPSCPFCAAQRGNTESDSFQRTQMLDAAEEDGQETQLYDEDIRSADKTVFVTDGRIENELTAGWLVCRNGLLRGKSYCIHSGRNFAGRALHMDVVLSDDPLLARENHFSVVCDPKSNRYYAVSGMGVTYINDVPLRGSAEIKDGDTISAGNSVYDFVPYCNERRTWDE